MTITLESIQAEHDRIGQLIAQFKEQAAQPAFFEYQGTRHDLKPGESYVGTIITAGEYGSYHLVLLPGEAEAINWKKAMEWAKNQGGELPNRVEGALLFQTMKGEFKEEAYWTREEGSDSGWAWFQDFLNGYQHGSSRSRELRARAVRRLIIE